MRSSALILSLSAVAALGACGGGESVYFIPGSGTLPSCSEPPALEVDGTVWFDSGTVTVLTGGCDDAAAGSKYAACPLDWAIAQSGNDLEIIVDGEYRILGRLCADRLHLEGGWWLPVEDGGQCTYEEDSAEEVGIEAEGNVLTVDAGDPRMTGVLVVQGRCRASYAVTLAPAAGR